MSTSETPRRTIILDSLQDYLEQLREEGMDGLPGVAPQTSGGPVAGITPTAGSPRAMPHQNSPTIQLPDPNRLTAQHNAKTTKSESISPAPSAISSDPFSRYPGLDSTLNLDALRDFIGACTRCKLAPKRTNLVFGVGKQDAELMFIGEAPGEDEDSQGEPFVGRAGQLLTDIIERGMGISRDDVYICNLIKCRPPGNRNPEPDEVSACQPFLFRQIELVRPRAIVGLGTFAVQALLKVKTPISKLRGIWHEVRGVQLMPTFHPSYLLRSPGEKRLVWADIQEVMKLLGWPIPSRPAKR
jgi:uracil-DNA glycosylase